MAKPGKGQSRIKKLSHSLANRSSQTVKQGFNHAGTRALLSLFIHQRCPVCDRPADGRHRTTPTPFCTDCQRQITTGCYPVKGWHLTATDNLAIGALGEYRGTLKQAILALKYKNCPEVAHSLGASLAQRWLGQTHLHTKRQQKKRQHTKRQPSNLYAVPIPLHPNRLAQRGYNQAALIAEAFCRVSGLPMLSHGLVREQDTAPQHQLGREERQSNLQSAFTVGKTLHRARHRSQTPPQILLIDDIYTTGTTAESAAYTLKTAGLNAVGMLSLARAIND